MATEYKAATYLLRMRLAIPIALIAAAWAGLVLGVDPIPTWFYVFAWYPTLVLLDELAHRVDGRPHLLRGWRRVVSLFGWSAVIWLVFEAANFRLANWYYVFLPRNPVERWTGILLSFGTVVPALVLMARLLDALVRSRALRIRPLPLTENQLWVSTALGVACAGVALTWPRIFFPLIWGAVWLMLEPFVYRRRRDLSLFADLARGDWDRTVRLLGAGLLVGGLWEFYNFWARGKWVYTVPWLEDLKLFEMPPLGFLGFPFFALEAWAMYSALACLGIAVPVATRHETHGRHETHERHGRHERHAIAEAQESHATHASHASHALLILACGAFCVATLLGMERWTVSSVVPALADVPSVETHVDELRVAGIDTPFELAAIPIDQLATTPGIPPERAGILTETAELVILRGLGVTHARRLRAIGITSRCELARRDPSVLWSRYHDRSVTFDPPTVTPPQRPTPAEVRVWVTSARRACGSEEGRGSI